MGDGLCPGSLSPRLGPGAGLQGQQGAWLSLMCGWAAGVPC